MQEGTPVPSWGYRCVPGLGRHNHAFSLKKIKQYDCVCQTKHKKHVHKFLYKKKSLKNVFKKSHPFTKGSVGACMQIVNLLTVQYHITAKDKNLFMCYKNITIGKQNGIASSHSSKLSVPTVLITSYRWYREMLSENLPYYPKGRHPQKVSGVALQLY